MTVRYSNRPLPQAAYVPGVSPRAQRPPAATSRTALEIDMLAADDDFRYGLDLFNHGFPWEAHEAWEPLWLAAPPDRPERALLHGLIHAAAAAVKAKAGALDPARAFIRSACEYLARAATDTVDVHQLTTALTAWARDPAQQPPRITLREGATALP